MLPVPLAEDCFGGFTAPGPRRKLRLVWNHRWEYDKGPALLLEIIEGLIAIDFDFECHLLGQQFRDAPREFERCVRVLRAAGCLGKVGFLKRPEYLATLRSSDVVLSTALHEFQGLSVLEAMACGCSPIVPDRLVYPELIDASCRYRSASTAVQLIGKHSIGNVRPDVHHFAWPAQRDAWVDVLKFSS